MKFLRTILTAILAFFVRIKNKFIEQKIEPPQQRFDRYKSVDIKKTNYPPWWVRLYHSVKRPKLTRLQPLDEFGNFSAIKPIAGYPLKAFRKKK